MVRIFALGACKALARNPLSAKTAETLMPIYELDGVAPDLAGETTINDNCWVAPCATLVGKIVLTNEVAG